MDKKLTEMTMNELLNAIRIQNQVTAKTQEMIVKEIERRVQLLVIGKKEITNELSRIESDDRLSYPPATVFENAPLALAQCGLENQRRALKWVLKVLESES